MYLCGGNPYVMYVHVHTHNTENRVWSNKSKLPVYGVEGCLNEAYGGVETDVILSPPNESCPGAQGKGCRATSATLCISCTFVQHNTLLWICLDVNIHETKLSLYYSFDQLPSIGRLGRKVKQPHQRIYFCKRGGPLGGEIAEAPPCAGAAGRYLSTSSSLSFSFLIPPL